MEAVEPSGHKAGVYERFFKRCLDLILSFGGLVVLSPVFLVLSVWIMIDDPGSVLFKQKRIGKDKQYFALHNVLERVSYPALCNKAPKIAA